MKLIIRFLNSELESKKNTALTSDSFVSISRCLANLEDKLAAYTGNKSFALEDDPAIDFADLFECLNEGKSYFRFDFDDPEYNFKIWVEGEEESMREEEWSTTRNNICTTSFDNGHYGKTTYGAE